MNVAFLFSLSGRFDRARFWKYAFGVPFLSYLVLIPLWFLYVAYVDTNSTVSLLALLVMIVIQVPVTVIAVAAMVRRLHDLGKSGWWCLLNLIPLVSILVFLWQGIAKGQVGPNRYGPDPLAEDKAVAARRWVVVGTSGQYANCEFPLDQDIVFGTDAGRCAVVIDARRHPDIDPVHCELRRPTGRQPPALYWPDARGGFSRHDDTFDGSRLDLSTALGFRVRPAE